MSDLDDALDATLRAMIAREAVWDGDDVDAVGGADALVAAIAAERAERSNATSSGRRAWARWLAPVAAGVAAAALTLVAYGLVRDDTTETADPPADIAVTMTPTELVPDASGTAEVTARPLGTVIRLDARGLPPAAPGTYYEAWMRTRTESVSAGTFHMRGGDGWVYLWSGVAAADYPELTVTVQTAGDPAPSGQVVLRARLD